ncbi:hypothetical protein N7520_004875 [Penicillium odoratum]|uniref:uncharacterized protein n=1 Tax=Penicillium odoratum TaxID=1167516 RepID=UPI00254849C9|nr:uncharacterized protein N7520_004875 [Penicillium odoratum]KAJ5765316.1 hypothetical protein N7520_004875 [Penicillium odoratum]
MIEAKTRHVDWSDIDEGTFTRLCEFAYLRNYTPPTFRLIDGKSPSKKATKKRKKKGQNSKWNGSWEELAPEPDPEPEPEPQPAPEFPEFEPEVLPSEAVCDDLEIPYKERSVGTGQLRDTFERSLVVPSSQTTELNYTFTPPQNTGPWEDFTPVFLEQARLYVLADKYGIDSLCKLVISKMYRTLQSFKLYDTGLSGIIELVRFVYMNTPPNYGGKIDAMRNFVTRYVVSVLGQIGENESFQEILEEGGPFVSDFWHIIWGNKENSSA